MRCKVLLRRGINHFLFFFYSHNNQLVDIPYLSGPFSDGQKLPASGLRAPIIGLRTEEPISGFTGLVIGILITPSSTGDEASKI